VRLAALLLALLSLGGGHRAGSAGVSVALPHGWHAFHPFRGVGPGRFVDPLTRLAVASGPIGLDLRSSCQVAGYAFPKTAVALVVVEWRHARGAIFPPRPRRFDAHALPIQRPPAIECFDGAGGSVQFADHGRTFGAYLLVGTRARATTVAAARRVLDTLRVEAR
jgi:hypothetical protein